MRIPVNLRTYGKSRKIQRMTTQSATSVSANKEGPVEKSTNANKENDRSLAKTKAPRQLNELRLNDSDIRLTQNETPSSTNATDNAATKENDLITSTAATVPTSVSTQSIHQPSMAAPSKATTSGPASKSKKFNCTVCTFETSRKSHFDHHVAFHQANPDLKIHRCDQCPYSSTRISCLKHHIVVHHTADSRAIRCDKCAYKTSDEKLLRKHKRLVHDPVKEKKREAMARDKRKRTEKEPFHCPKCAYRSKSYYLYVRHLRQHSTEPLARKIDKNELLDPTSLTLVGEFQCPKVKMIP